MNKIRQNLRIDHVEQVNQWVRCFRLVPAAESDRLYPFLPGQYLNLFYQIDGSTTSRPYSIASSPKDAERGFYELYIHGGGSYTARWLFQNGIEGQILQASIPAGDFHYVPGRDTPRLIGISGGMSVTPLRSMARAVVDGSLDVELTIFCGWDSAQDILYYKEFQEYTRSCPRFKGIFNVLYGDIEGAERGYVTLEMIQKYTDVSGATFFLCGPAEMYAAVAQELAPLHIPPERCHRELPGEANTAVFLQEFTGIGQRRYCLTVTIHGQTHRISMDSTETVLVAMERAGLAPEARCRSGHCGFCQSKLTEGHVFVPSRWQTSTTDNLIHPCCSFPLSDLVIEMDT